ncbi:MAG: DUF370 domain-containing protein [Clostridia bacterium]|nr:DUF370 domain-containing protein [Clostridia bacterium]
MFLHLGNDYIVFNKDIIAVLDFETTTTSKITREFLKEAEEEGFIINVSEDIPKSFIITETKGRSKIYISNIASSTLLKRIEGDKKGEENE